MRKRLKWLFTLVMVLFFFITMGKVSYAASSADITVKGQSDVKQGDTATVTVSIKNNPGVLGATLKVNYDSNLTLTNAENGTAFSGLTMTKPGKFESGCKFVWDGLSTPASSDGEILKLTFAVSENAKEGSSLSVKVTVTDMIDDALSDIDTTVTNGSITVKEGTSTPDPEDPPAVDTENYKYTVNEDGKTITISKCFSEEIKLIVPRTIDGYEVTIIGERAFADCSNLASVILPDGVTTIESYSFQNCTSLYAISLPSSLEMIYDNAFLNTNMRMVVYRDTKEAWKKNVYVYSVGNEQFVEALKLDINSEGIDFVKPKVKSVSVYNAEGGVCINASISNGDEYYVYRSENGSNYTKIGHVYGEYNDYYIDKKVVNGKKYWYKVAAAGTNGTKQYISPKSSAKSYYYVRKPRIKKLKNKATKQMQIEWVKNSKATGYQVEYTLKSNFSSSKVIKVKGASKVSTIIKNLKSKKNYYVRVRAYKSVGGKNYYSEWSIDEKVKITK